MSHRSFPPSSPARRRALRSLTGLAGTALASLAAPMPTRAAPAEADLSNVTLVLGDQAGGLRALAEAARVLDGTRYRFRWANFQGAAPLFEAQRAGAIDLAPAGDLPVLTAALGDPDLRIVATRAGSPASLGIVVQPDSAVRNVADLKGRTVVVSSARGSISQYQLYGALEERGLSRTDVEVRFVLPVDAFAAFESKRIDIWATFDPYYGHVVRRGARVLRDGSGINSGLGFPDLARADPGRSRQARGARRRARQARTGGPLGARASGRLREGLCLADPPAARRGQRHHRARLGRAARRDARRHRDAAARRRSRATRRDPAGARRRRRDLGTRRVARLRPFASPPRARRASIPPAAATRLARLPPPLIAFPYALLRSVDT